MIAFQLQNLTKSFGDRVVLDTINLVVEERERIGLIGANGSGKTTLLRCLTGELAPDSGQVSIASNRSLGWLEQLPPLMPGHTAWDATMMSFAHLIEMRQQLHDLEVQMGECGPDLDRVMDQYGRLSEAYERANGYACENTARRLLTGLGFTTEEFYQPYDSFSGGQKTRLNLARLLAESPDIILLDEPTNHLDMDAVEWLEDFVAAYPGTVLVVSHDRMFLDRIATGIAEVRNGAMRSYSGNYSAYQAKKTQEDLAEERAYEKQQEYIRQTEAYIQRFKAGIKAKQARGRESQLKRLERLNAPERTHKIGHNRITMERESGNEVLNIIHLSKGYPGRPVLEDINLQVKKGDKIAVIGPNGCGKTTLLKLINGLIPPDQGEIRLGSRVKIAYFSQEHSDLDPRHTLLQEIYDNFDLTLEEARNMLGGMLFQEDDVFKLVGELSGGELSRLALLKMILSGANFLLLDEPSNHLDIPSCQRVEQILADYPGTILLVSHDRYFIDRVVNRILVIEGGKSEYYWGNYAYYREKKSNQANTMPDSVQVQIPVREQAALLHREKQKAEQRQRRRLEQEQAALEGQINHLEERKKELEIWLSEPGNYVDETQARQYSSEYNQIDQIILESYERWEKMIGEH